MLKSYTYLESDHSKLHEFILSFFNRIENETGDFDISFFDPEFQAIVTRHRKILKECCENLYNTMNTWDQPKKSEFCRQIRESNNIEGICNGSPDPLKLNDIPEDIRSLTKDLFIKLYEQVLDGPAFTSQYATLREHFDAFRELNNDITVCPICGITELKTRFDKSRDQYDHYLPKSIYPLSSVNFKNLVPICTECNSFNAKGDKDTIVVSTGKLFFLYDAEHEGINIAFEIESDDTEIDNIEWSVQFSSPDPREDEIQSWRNIYEIDSRYLGLVKGRIQKWYKAYWEYMNDGDLSHLSEEDRKLTYQKYMEKDEENHLNYIKKPALETFLSGSVFAQAEAEARQYS